MSGDHIVILDQNGTRKAGDCGVPTPLGARAKKRCSLRSSFLLTAAMLGLIVLSLSACGVDVEGEEAPADKIFSPVGMALHPSGDYLYVVNSNFLATYRDDRGGTVSVVEVATGKIVDHVTLGSYGGEIKLNQPTAEDGSDLPPTRAYVTVRGDDSIVVLNLSEDGSELFCIEGLSGSATCRVFTERKDPFSLAVKTETRAGRTFDFVVAGHLASQDATAFTLDLSESLPNDGAIGKVSAPLALGIASIEYNVSSGNYYATSQLSNSMVVFRPVYSPEGELDALRLIKEVPLQSSAVSGGGVNSRNLVFDFEEDLLYVAHRGIPTVNVFDVGTENAEFGTGTRDALTWNIDTPREPGGMALVDVGGDYGKLLYVACFSEEVVAVIDPDRRRIIDLIEMNTPPYALTYNPARGELYVSLFEDDAVAVIDVSAESEGFHGTPSRLVSDE